MVNRGIICAGCWTLDRIKIVDQWPAEEALARIIKQDKLGGGSGHNVSLDLKNLDPNFQVLGMGLLGVDPEGDFLYQQAVLNRVDPAGLLRTEDHHTSYTDVYTVASTGKRTFFHSPGANDALTPQHLDFSNTSAKMLHLGLLGLHATLDNAWNGDPNGWVTVLKAAKAAGLKTNIELVSIQPERNRELCLPCLPYLDSLIVNDQEIGGLANIDTIPNGVVCVDSCIEAALKILEKGAMNTVVVHYPHGSVCVEEAKSPVISTSFNVPAADIISSVGAGDAFAAGVLYGLHENWDINRTLELAHAASAASLRSPTTVGSVGTVAECLQYAHTCGKRPS